MAKKDTIAASAATPEPAGPAVKEAPKGSMDPIVVKYRNHIGEPTEREFSPEVHGPDFATLAEEFRTTNADKLIA